MDHNKLEHLKGLSSLAMLGKLDVSFNHIHSLEELKNVQHLKMLRDLNLQARFPRDGRRTYQLLVEMDGSDAKNSSVIVIGATNRTDVPDKALIRPGRFDRKVEMRVRNRSQDRVNPGAIPYLS